MLCRIVVVGSRDSIDTDCYGVFCFVIFMFSCAWYVLLVAWQSQSRKKQRKALMLNPPYFTEHTTNVVIQQNNHKFLMTDILMSETC